VRTDDLQVLLLKRFSPFVFWQSVTGSLEPGELPAAAAQRELTEETGLTDEGRLIDTNVSRSFTIDPRWLDRYPPGVNDNREYEWHYRLEAPTDIVIEPKEHSDWKWVPIEVAIETVWSWSNREALQILSKDHA